jgi:hypothetical protein
VPAKVELVAIMDGRQIAFDPKEQVLAQVATTDNGRQQTAAVASAIAGQRRRLNLKVLSDAS